MLRFTDNLIIQMTRKCNLNCKYCYEQHVNLYGNKYINFEDFKKLVDTTLYYRCILGRLENHIDFHFHGGEVLLLPWDELKKDIEYLMLRKQIFPGIEWCIQSNGLKITDEIAQYFAVRGKAFGLSFDGFSATERMDSSTTQNFIKRLRFYHETYGTKFSSISVLTKDNIKNWYKDMVEVSDIMDTVGANILCPVIGQEDLVPSIEDQWNFYYKPVLESFKTDNPLRERELSVVLAVVIGQILFGLPTAGKTGCFNKLCGFGSNMTSVSPDLKLGACDKFLEKGPYRDLLKEYSLDKTDFLGLQQANRTIHFYKKMFKIFDELKCYECPAAGVCAGECQAYNTSKTGQLSLNSDNCTLIKKTYEFIENYWPEILQHMEIDLQACPLTITPTAQSRLEREGLSLMTEFIDFENIKVKVIKKEN